MFATSKYVRYLNSIFSNQFKEINLKYCMEPGAIDSETNYYVLPSKAEKGRTYKCADCNEKVILRQGKIRIHHFAHSNKSNCQYFEHPNESQQHKDAKMKLAERLKQKFKIKISNSCPKCECWPTLFDDYEVKYERDLSVIVEYRDPKGKYIADIAVLEDNKVAMIFEIKHTHETTTNVRPEPWFEITTKDIFDNENRIQNNIDEGLENDKYYLDCIRKSLNRFCINCKIPNEIWAKNIPSLSKRYGQERMWEQEKPCIICGTKSYSPQYIQGPRQVCQICVSTDYDKLKEMYNKSLFDD